jgi:hypothetical protein
MARITYTAVVDNIRGSINGTTFQKNAYGYTIKSKPNMVNPWTQNQKIMQIAFSQAVKAWKIATDVQRANWETWASTNPQYAKHNPSAMLSGFACFTKWTMFELLSGGVVDYTPLLTIPAAPGITLKLINSTGTLLIDINGDSLAEDWNLAFFASRPFGASQNFIGTKTKYVGSYTDVAGQFPITALYISNYGSLPAVGDRVAIDYVRFMEAGGSVMSRVQTMITVTAS